MNKATNEHSFLESANVSLPTLNEVEQISSSEEADKLLHRIHQLEHLHIDDPDMLVKLREVKEAVLHKSTHNYLSQLVRADDAEPDQQD